MQREHGRFLRGCCSTWLALFALYRARCPKAAASGQLQSQVQRSSVRGSVMSEMILAWIICDLSGTCTAPNCFYHDAGNLTRNTPRFPRFSPFSHLATRAMGMMFHVSLLAGQPSVFLLGDKASHVSQIPTFRT